MMIQPIVEGYGDVKAVPVLLRRFVDLSQLWEHVRIGSPIRRQRSELVRRPGVEKAIGLARAQGADAVLILFDGDDDCPAKLGPKVQRWAKRAAGDIPCQVVMPHREYEAWFLAAVESLRGLRGVRPDALPPLDPERPRGAKEQLEGMMRSRDEGAAAGTRGYLEVIDQPAFSARFSMDAAYAGCRSFRKMTSAFGALLQATGYDAPPWPPFDANS